MAIRGRKAERAANGSGAKNLRSTPFFFSHLSLIYGGRVYGRAVIGGRLASIIERGPPAHVTAAEMHAGARLHRAPVNPRGRLHPSFGEIGFIREDAGRGDGALRGLSTRISAIGSMKLGALKMLSG